MAAQMAGSCVCSMDIDVAFVQKSIVRDIDRIGLSETIALRPVSRRALAPVSTGPWAARRRPVNRRALAPVFFRPSAPACEPLGARPGFLPALGPLGANLGFHYSTDRNCPGQLRNRQPRPVNRQRAWNNNTLIASRIPDAIVVIPT